MGRAKKKAERGVKPSCFIQLGFPIKPQNRGTLKTTRELESLASSPRGSSLKNAPFDFEVAAGYLG